VDSGKKPVLVPSRTEHGVATKPDFLGGGGTAGGEQERRKSGVLHGV